MNVVFKWELLDSCILSLQGLGGLIVITFHSRVPTETGK